MPRLTSHVVKLQAVRGAITCDEDTKEEIEAKTTRLVKEVLARNDLTPDDLVSIIFTTTPDLHAQFPATVARTTLGLEDVALLGAVEQDVPHGMPRCIRLLVHCYTEKPRKDLRHVFLEGASALRADLAQ